MPLMPAPPMPMKWTRRRPAICWNMEAAVTPSPPSGSLSASEIRRVRSAHHPDGANERTDGAQSAPYGERSSGHLGEAIDDGVGGAGTRQSPCGVRHSLQVGERRVASFAVAA